MTKSRQSAIKLRLSRLIRCLLALGALKLAIMGVALLDLPMPAWLGSSEPVQKATPGPEYSAPATAEAVPSVDVEPAQAALEEMPQGSAAAELAAAARPKRRAGAENPGLPSPLVAAGPRVVADAGAFVAPLLPEPPALDAPLAAAGVIVPEPEYPRKEKAEDSVWNMLDLKSLPIPGLGSVRAANAAALDMPVPNTPAQPSPFTPAEQASAGSPIVLPGAPPLPANLPRGQAADGSPLPMREDGLLPPLPRQGEPVAIAPAPSVTPLPTSLDHNAKSQELARQQQDILMLRQQMDQRLKDLQTAEDKMKGMLKEAKDLEDKKVASLVQMYANMKPRMAAQAMENMDERIAVRILNGMAPKQSGEILTYTNPAKTAKFTEMMTRMRMAE